MDGLEALVRELQEQARLADARVADDDVLEEVRLLGRRGGHVGLPRWLAFGLPPRAACAGARRGCSARVLGPARAAAAHRFGARIYEIMCGSGRLGPQEVLYLCTS